MAAILSYFSELQMVCGMDAINAFAFVQGKTSVDWFFDFKLHLVVNDFGELLNITVTSGNTDSSLKLSAYPELRLFTIA